MRRALPAVFLAAALTLSGCGSSDEPSPDETSAASPTEEPSESEPTDDSGEHPEGHTDEHAEELTVEVEIEGDQITPNGQRMDVPVGHPVTLEVSSDRAVEFHVHSSPEQVLQAPAGDSTLELTIDRPGVVQVEEHESGLVVLELEVS